MKKIILAAMLFVAIRAGAQTNDPLAVFTLPDYTAQPQIGSGTLIMVGGAIVLAGVYMTLQIKAEADRLEVNVPFPATVNNVAPFWPLNTADLSNKKNLGKTVDCTSSAYHSSIPKSQTWMNPNTGFDFTDIFVFKFRASPDLNNWSHYNAVVWVDEAHNYVMNYGGSVSCGYNCNSIYCCAPDVGPNSGFVQAYR